MHKWCNPTKQSHVKQLQQRQNHGERSLWVKTVGDDSACCGINAGIPSALLEEHQLIQPFDKNTLKVIPKWSCNFLKKDESLISILYRGHIGSNGVSDNNPLLNPLFTSVSCQQTNPNTDFWELHSAHEYDNRIICIVMNLGLSLKWYSEESSNSHWWHSCR